MAKILQKGDDMGLCTESNNQESSNPITDNGHPLPDLGNLNRIWGRQISWQVRLRWWVAPAILAAVLMGRQMGFEFRMQPILCIAGLILAYNAALTVFILSRSAEGEQQDRRYSIVEVSLDYASMFALIFCTGGAASPLIFFFIFHVIFAAIHFRASIAFLFAGIATVGMWALATCEFQGILTSLPLRFQGQTFSMETHSGYVMSMLGFFSASVLIAAGSTASVMGRLRDRVDALVLLARRIADLNDRLQRLHTMTKCIGAERSLNPILDIVTREFAAILHVEMTSIKLLDKQRRVLDFVANWGLPESITRERVPLTSSRINRRIIGGETLAIGALTDDEDFYLKEQLCRAGVKSLVCAPLKIEDRVIGVLSAYSCEANQFSNEEDIRCINMVAELTALAIDNADAYGEIRSLLEERSQFTLQVAHNMRAPLGASLGMLELISSAYMGDVTEKQLEYLTRVEKRLQALNRTVGELMTLAQTKDRSREIVDTQVNVGDLVAHLRQTFNDDARKRKIRLNLKFDESLPLIDSGVDLMYDMMENLISNSLKYTLAGGRVDIEFSRFDDENMRIIVSDTGIGIPADEQSKLFREFFRARNARQLDEVGTGLGLPLIQQTVLRHGGSIFFTSEEGEGTRFVIDLPFRRESQGLSWDSVGA
ncbi:MAG: GAF domain-containing sensor histidine kinase [bacterium]|nr:GAF domain-containing sensor histidine kinase [bacterium]